MTEKELLYIEDTINHIMLTSTICQYYENELQDKKLQKFISTISKQYDTMYNNIYSLLK